MMCGSKKTFFVISGLLLFCVLVKLLGGAAQRSDLHLWVACPVYFLLGAVSVVVIWAAVKRQDW